MSEFRMQFAADEWERAQHDAEIKRLAWKVARTASPTFLPLDEMEAYCEAADAEAQAHSNFVQAQLEAQTEWSYRMSNAAKSADPTSRPEVANGSVEFGASPDANPSPAIPESRVRRTAFISARED